MLKVSDLTKVHDVEPLFEHVSFVLNDGDRVGLVGPNGVGKTTMFEIIAGVEEASSGSVRIGSDDRVGYLRQEAKDTGLSVGEHLRRSLGEVWTIEVELKDLETRMSAGEVAASTMQRYGSLQEHYGALGGWAIDELIEGALERLEVQHIPLTTPFGALSGGQQARVMMAGALLRDPTILLLDEPTNHMDLDGIEWMEQFVAHFAGVVLTISHDRRYLDRCIRRIFELDGISPDLQVYEGGYSDYKIEKQRRWERRLLDFEAQEKHRKRLEADIERAKRQASMVESSTRNDHARRLAAKVAKKAKSRERILERQMKMAGWLAHPETRPKLTIRFTGSTTVGARLLDLENVTFDYDSRPVLKGVDFDLRGRDRVALIGANGSGKSTLMRVLRDALVVQRRPSVGYLPQDQRELPLDESVLGFFRASVVMHEDEARTILDRFLLEKHQLGQPLGALSSGERTRLAVAALVCSDAECLLLDEPTNHLDFDSLDIVEEALREYEGTLVVVSHDRHFLRDIRITQVAALRDGRLDRSWAARLERELASERLTPDLTSSR